MQNTWCHLKSLGRPGFLLGGALLLLTGGCDLHETDNDTINITWQKPKLCRIALDNPSKYTVQYKCEPAGLQGKIPPNSHKYLQLKPKSYTFHFKANKKTVGPIEVHGRKGELILIDPTRRGVYEVRSQHLVKGGIGRTVLRTHKAQHVYELGMCVGFEQNAPDSVRVTGTTCEAWIGQLRRKKR